MGARKRAILFFNKLQRNIDQHPELTFEHLPIIFTIANKYLTHESNERLSKMGKDLAFMLKYIRIEVHSRHEYSRNLSRLLKQMLREYYRIVAPKQPAE